MKCNQCEQESGSLERLSSWELFSARADRQKGILPEREEKTGEQGEPWRVKPELDTNPVQLAAGSDARSEVLSRGQYRVTLTFPYDGPEVHRTSFPRSIPFEDEYKRVWIYKQDLKRVKGETGPDGEPLGRMTLVFRVLDNPLPLVPIVWALSGVASAGAGWFFIDKLEGFTETTAGSILSIAAAVVTLIGAWVWFS